MWRHREWADSWRPQMISETKNENWSEGGKQRRLDTTGRTDSLMTEMTVEKLGVVLGL